jgi:hypothetical protein
MMEEERERERAKLEEFCLSSCQISLSGVIKCVHWPVYTWKITFSTSQSKERGNEREVQAV